MKSLQLARLRKAVVHADAFAALVQECGISDARSQLEVTVRCLYISTQHFNHNIGVHSVDEGAAGV